MSGLETAALMATLTSIGSAAATAAPFVAAAGTLMAGQAAADLGAAEDARLQYAGRANKQAADYEAAQLDIQGKEERAAAQREAMGLRRQKALALSSIQARGASGGFTATDPTSLALADEVEKYGTLQEQMAMYGGTSRAESMKAGADARRISGETEYQSSLMAGNIARQTGEAKRMGSYFDAAGTIMGGASTFASKYAKKAPVKTTGRYG